MQASMKKALFISYTAVHVRVREELQDVFVFPTREGVYPYHVQRVQQLRPEDFAERLNFCKWLNGRRHLHGYIMFTDEAQFNRDGVNNTHSSHLWGDENPHSTVESFLFHIDLDDGRGDLWNIGSQLNIDKADRPRKF
jgi:hypothetical protein